MHTLQLRRPLRPDIVGAPQPACHAPLNIIDISFQEEACEHTRAASAMLALWQIKRLDMYIADHMALRIRTLDLAAALNLSVSHFSRIFKQTIGMSPRNYVLAKRVAAASRTMLQSGLHLTEIAYMHGFCDQSHFNRAFHAANGLSPQEWRKLNKQPVSKECAAVLARMMGQVAA